MDAFNVASIYHQVVNVIHTQPLPTVALVVLSAVFAQNPARRLEVQMDIACSVLEHANFRVRFQHRFPATVKVDAARTVCRILLVRAMLLLDEPATTAALSRLAHHVLDDVSSSQIKTLWNDTTLTEMCRNTLERLQRELNREANASRRTESIDVTFRGRFSAWHPCIVYPTTTTTDQVVLAEFLPYLTGFNEEDASVPEAIKRIFKKDDKNGVTTTECPNTALIFGSIDI